MVGPPPLMGEALLRVWEAGARQHPIDRAVTILAASHEDVPPDRLAALTVGHRNAALLDLREATFGPTLRGFVACPTCGEHLEVALDAPVIRSAAYPAPGNAEAQPAGAFEVEGWTVRFRVPDSRDLAEFAAGPDAASGRAELIRRCVLAAERDGVAAEPADLPEAVVRELAQRMAERDPQAEILLDLVCPACDRRWQAPFDIVLFFWEEIVAAARRLLRDVHALARAYGWREADVLAMSARRRQAYLELVDG